MSNSQVKLEEIRCLLKDVDKYLFVMFRNKDITFDQLRARVAEKQQNLKYTVLDDLKKELDPETLKGMDEELFFKIYKSEVKDGKRIVPLSELQKPPQTW